MRRAGPACSRFRPANKKNEPDAESPDHVGSRAVQLKASVCRRPPGELPSGFPAGMSTWERRRRLSLVMFPLFRRSPCWLSLSAAPAKAAIPMKKNLKDPTRPGSDRETVDEVGGLGQARGWGGSSIRQRRFRGFRAISGGPPRGGRALRGATPGDAGWARWESGESTGSRQPDVWPRTTLHGMVPTAGPPRH